MKKQYQIQKRRAAEQFQQQAKNNPTPIQLIFSTAGIAELAQHSLGDLLRTAGKMFIETVMESEVDQLAGVRSQPNPERSAYRRGTEAGFCISSTTRGESLTFYDLPDILLLDHSRHKLIYPMPSTT